jgi:hypothetical protein
MDEIVKAALKKWPNVPHCYGWLALDARGDWYMRDDRIQAAGPFPQVKGSRIVHDKLRSFIHRNYAADAAGCWFFQNGPQRVYVELEAAPWVWRLPAPGAGRGAQPHRPAPPAARPGWTKPAGSSCTPTSAWAWCTAGHGHRRRALEQRRVAAARRCALRRDAGSLRLPADP